MQLQKYLRYALIAGMAVTSYLLVLAWQEDNKAAQPVATMPVATQTAASDVPPAQLTATTSDVPAALAQQETKVVSKDLISVTTDKYFLQINPVGGDVVRLDLLEHKAKLGGEKAMRLLETQARTYVAQSGLQGVNGTDTAKGRATYAAAQQSYTMQEGKKLQVPLTYTDALGVTVTKTFTFTPGKYPIDMTYTIDNTSSSAWQANLYAQLKRDNSADPGKDDRGFMGMVTYLGGAWGTPDEPYNKLDFEDFSDEDDQLNMPAKAGWVAVIQHYFVSSWIPSKDYNTKLFTFSNAGNNIIGFNSEPFVVAPNTQKQISATLYAGPKIQEELSGLAEGLNQTVDFGFLWPIAKLLYTILISIYSVFGNWGWSIIALTIIVKCAFMWLSNKSYRSMGKMRILAPKMEAIKNKHGDDRMAVSQEMMKLYKEEKVNPMAGCLPIIIQMPIFLALYWVLVESVELRHAPWLGWIQDLAQMDPYFILPILMGASMYVSQMLNPQPTDPMQAKVFKFLPIMFTAFMLFFPAGLVLYWTVNNIFTVAQQTYINREIQKEQQQKEQKA